MSSTKKIYEMSRDQVLIVKKYIEKIFEKDYIRSNISLYVVSIFII